jgi:hypothetical protein
MELCRDCFRVHERHSHRTTTQPKSHASELFAHVSSTKLRVTERRPHPFSLRNFDCTIRPEAYAHLLRDRHTHCDDPRLKKERGGDRHSDDPQPTH